MTTMDSDSESQDSDDGRRFRFEATRKDNLEPETKLKKLSKSKSEHKSSYNAVEYANRKGKSNRNCNKDEHKVSRERDVNNRDIKCSKHSHDSRSSRHDDSKDYKNVRDVTLSTRSSVLPSKHKTRDAKRHRNRDRDEHHKNRSHERSRSRNDHDRHQNDKHRNKSHEKYKYHSHDKNRDRGYQSHKARPEDRDKLRSESEKCNVFKQASTEDNEQRYLQGHSLSKSVEQDRSDSEFLAKGDLLADSQDCKELNLSEFDVLSETDENTSDSSDIKDKSSVLQQSKIKTRKRNSNDRHKATLKKQATEIEHSEGLAKVNARTNELLHGSSNNNSGTISDSTLGTISPISMEINQDCKNKVYQKCEYELKKNTVDLNHKENDKNSLDKGFLPDCDITITDDTLHSLHVSDENSTYGPSLPPSLVTDSFNDVHSVKNKVFIGPCLPENNIQSVITSSENNVSSNIKQNVETSESFTVDSNVTFGPALPPHLLKQKCDSDTSAKITAPIFPSTTQSFDNGEKEPTESEDEDAIGPLPVDHPALKTNYVYRKLEQRALEIQKEQKNESDTTSNQREEWMTELPSIQVNNLGLTSRKFRIKSGPDMSDRSCWTDTPAKKAEKQKQQESEMDNTSTIASKESYEVDPGENRKQKRSLLEIHQSKLRKKKKKEEARAKVSGETIRRPFDRNIDLQINRFDPAKRNAVLNKAQYLDDRFSRGKF